ncbi:MAG: Crp/Fnr family transcriptional regulator [Leptospira sp.]|nr:Crp/Fnr family transcriptional regulator [Leptospira sp.]
MPNFWKLIPQEIFEKFGELPVLKTYGKGEIVFSEQDEFTGFYVVATGKFKVYNLNENGKEAILKISGEEEAIAAPLFFSGMKQYPASLEAIENGSLYFFEIRRFREFMKNNPGFSPIFASITMQNVHYLKEKVSSLMLHNLRERMLEYLKQNGAERKFIHFPIPKNQLALLLDATPESISRCLKSLEEEKIIEISGEQIKIP